MGLLTLQRKYDSSIFGCEAQDVFADVEVSLGKGTTTLKVEDLLNEFHVLKRKGTGSWVNWGMFYQVWMKVRDVGKWYNHDYFIKVDPDAVFLPARMRSWLQGRKDTDHGVYYENCKNVQMGFFGNLEVLTKRAIAALLGNLEDCHGVRTSGCRGAWIGTSSTRLRHLMRPQMGLVRLTGPRARRRTRNGTQRIAPESSQQQCTPSRSPRSTSSVWVKSCSASMRSERAQFGWQWRSRGVGSCWGSLG